MQKRGLNKLVLASPEAGVGSNCLLHGMRREGEGGRRRCSGFVYCFFLAMRSLLSYSKQQRVAALLRCGRSVLSS